jgi:hypothetical protein
MAETVLVLPERWMGTTGGTLNQAGFSAGDKLGRFWVDFEIFYAFGCSSVHFPANKSTFLISVTCSIFQFGARVSDFCEN